MVLIIGCYLKWHVFVCDQQAGKSQSPQFSMGNFSSTPSSSASSSFGQMGGASANVAANTTNYSQMNARSHQSTNGYGKKQTLSFFLNVTNTHSRSLTPPPGDMSQTGPQFSSRPAEATAWQQWQNQPHTQNTADTHAHIQNSQPEIFTVSGVCEFYICYSN